MADPTLVAQISRKDLESLSAPPSASIADVKHLSSYNWIEAPTPTIAVPGSPSVWSPPKTPRKVNKDSGLIYIAQNAARHPDSPLEPLFRALYIANPSFDIRSTDVVTDRNNIRKLLSFINPVQMGRKTEEPFTINIEVAGNTAIFSRAETATVEFIGPGKHIGFGHEFEKAYTTNQISGSTGHHRIVSYSLGDLNFIVRHETDGCVDAGAGTSSSRSAKSENDSLANLLGSLSLSRNTSTPDTTPQGSKLTIRQEGKITPLESTLEIKTRSARNQLNIEEVIPQLWVSQTSKFVIAHHNNGFFPVPNVQDVKSQIKKWEERNEKDLRKLAALINKIRDVVKEGGGKAVLRYVVEGDKLVIEKDEGKKMLPKDLYSKWDEGDDAEAETKAHHGADDERAEKHRTEGKTKAGDKSIEPRPGDKSKGKTNAEDKTTIPTPKDPKSKGKATEPAKEALTNKTPDAQPAKGA